VLALPEIFILSGFILAGDGNKERPGADSRSESAPGMTSD
jgi:hypothetical protein